MAISDKKLIVLGLVLFALGAFIFVLGVKFDPPPKLTAGYGMAFMVFGMAAIVPQIANREKVSLPDIFLLSMFMAYVILLVSFH